jgi:hypothetical protein
VKYLRELLSEEWFRQEVTCDKPRHLLGLWHKKNPNNHVARHADEMVEYILNGGRVKCDLARLTTKLKGEFLDTLIEIDYAFFLAENGLQVILEPSAPKSGPDILAVEDNEYFVEIKRVTLDEAHAAGDMASEDVFKRLCDTASRYSFVIRMTEEYSAYSPQLKQALKVVSAVLAGITKRGVKEATLYYYSREAFTLQEGEEPALDYSNRNTLAAQLQEQEKRRNAHFVARFDESDTENARTPVAVLPEGQKPNLVKEDQTHLRLKAILNKKRDQLPPGARGIITLEISELAKLMVDDFTLMRTLYGDLAVRLTKVPGTEEFQEHTFRKANGFFFKTSRASAVVFEHSGIKDDKLVFTRNVFPTNNPQAAVLTLKELKLFGVIAKDLEDLCAENLDKANNG